ncbi:YncE family protein [Saccharomonospora azurea]
MKTRTHLSTLGAVALAAVLAATLTACSGEGEVTDELQVVENPTAATAQPSPETGTEPAGSVIPLDGDVTAMTAVPDSGVVAVAVTDPARVLLYDGDALDRPGTEPTVVELPGPVENLTAAGDELLAPVPSENTLARITLDGNVELTPTAGGPTGAAVHGEDTLVSLRERKGVGVLDGDRLGPVVEGGLNSADDVVVAEDQPVVLDRVRSAVFEVDVDGGDVGAGLRAGQGATNVVTDDYGRVFVSDTRSGGILAFSVDPLLLRQLYPVPGGVYGMAYDSERDVLWATLTARNEVVGFDVHGGELQEQYRYPTVRQPDSVTVDSGTSRVVVGSASGEGIQVIAP